MELHEYEIMAGVEHTHWWYVGMRHIADVWLRALPVSHILDTGCGTGGNLPWLRDYGQVVGMDYADIACAYGSRLHERVACASIEALPFHQHQFNLVTCLDVLYHQSVTDEIRALRECYRVLQPGGYILVRVPALEWLRGAHHMQVHGARRYTPARIHALLAQTGFVVNKLHFVNSLLLPAVWAQIMYERWARQPAHKQSHLQLPKTPINAFGLHILRFEAFLLSIGASLPIGVSLLCLAQRPKVDGVE